MSCMNPFPNLQCPELRIAEHQPLRSVLLACACVTRARVVLVIRLQLGVCLGRVAGVVQVDQKGWWYVD
eukprot:8695175-Pyramimonas_sp.AAC.2